MTWTDSTAPRIWRCPESDFYGDEPRDAADVYTSRVLGDIQSHGFNGIWLRGRMHELMHSTVLGQLNDPDAEPRRRSMRTVIERGREMGVGTYLFLNEPLALPVDHPLWEEHPQLKGETYWHPVKKKQQASICTSTPLCQRFFRDAIGSLLDALPGLAGVILITATEYHTHCWSHVFRHSLNDGVGHEGKTTPDCPRCREREPADVVLELLQAWNDVGRVHAPACRIFAWNWSWSMWYRDPQAEIVSRLPERLELLVDFERGGQRTWRDHTIKVDEYALSYIGPSQRFLATQAAAADLTPVHAKLQIGATHEIGTVPNLPLMPALHAKFKAMTDHHVAGTMACWNFGCSLTLNTFAFGLYQHDPERYADEEVFLSELAQHYFGLDRTEQTDGVLRAWRGFDAAFTHYPFSIAFLYFSPVSDAPAHPLSLQYQAQRLGPAWLPHEFGDDLTRCLGEFDVDQVADSLERVASGWQTGLEHYARILDQDADHPNAAVAQRRWEELHCAGMIHLQLRSAAHIFRFHQRRLELTGGQTDQPRTLPRDEQLLALMRAEIANAKAALPLTKADPRLGFHQESHTAMYNPELIERKIQTMEAELANPPAVAG